MKQWKTENGTQIIKLLSGRINVYLVKCSGFNILVDTGMCYAYRSLKKAILKSLPLSETVSYLVLTHTHFDHCRNAHRIKRDYQCRIVAGENESNCTEAGFTPIPEGTNWFTKRISNLGKRLGRSFLGYYPFTVDVVIQNQLKIENQSSKIEMISTPGHSTGSISVLVDNEIALVGDAMFGTFKNSIFPPFADDVTEMKRSWKKLLDTGCNIFFPGHGKEICKKLVEKEIEKHQALTSKIN
ncbi:MAG TPA: MBL fold metallo-hydrolase [Tenuifilaceae bacterium]|nr:MBL fold metallo-hydrolase [Tenuifilaceae bacterium]HPE17083.1 MBL fold metallo-hydrolase [Tenuifilaceae bacterium]HPJ44811.1 MBL fold metallo-hydrolase [Tenuifilaceae bacterium]HPQ32895.1 MBL fold metallo-hydrolase [Tenuifilaceae bacterium]HRX67176.1 MBL fold metallo-hydrolase [Tenuifilaceae bacterium]